jgi:Protein of unknown function (DUF2612)
MSNNVVYYQALVTSEYQEQPNFQAVIALSVAPYVQIQMLLDSMIPLFDLMTPPVGNQLDIIGQWVGVSREIENPFSDIFFTWDGTAAQGWDFGIWQSSDNPDAIIVLPDDEYLLLIQAKIGANNWDGTTYGAYAIYAKLFPNNTVLYIDYQNMSFAVALIGQLPDSLTLALLTGGYLELRPEGVEITEYFIPVNTGPIFAWDTEDATLQGWDQGSWAQEIFPT